MSVLIGYAHPATVDGHFHDALVGLLIADAAGPRNVAGVVGVLSGPQIAIARNRIVETLLASDAEWLLMLDADMTFEPDVLEQLLAVANGDSRPIVGALCFAVGPDGIGPTLYYCQPQAEPYERDALVRVDATGAACILMHRTALTAVIARFGDCYGDAHGIGEDLEFCVRAGEVGVPIHVHTGIEAGHVKSTVIDQAAYDRSMTA